MELPTYTNIWKIEKRLYKLYDFRLPMPLPVGQVAAFLAIAIPYMLILTMAGMPFSHTWVWLYVLPPGVLAWLVTRPVLEGKRLPELVLSQLRYLVRAADVVPDGAAGGEGPDVRDGEGLAASGRPFRLAAIAGAHAMSRGAAMTAPGTAAPATPATAMAAAAFAAGGVEASGGVTA